MEAGDWRRCLCLKTLHMAIGIGIGIGTGTTGLPCPIQTAATVRDQRASASSPMTISRHASLSWRLATGGVVCV